MAQPIESAVIRVLRDFRITLDARDAQALSEMAKRYLVVQSSLEADMIALAVEMEQRRAEGKVITQQMIWRAERFKRLNSQLADQMRVFSADAMTQIKAGQVEGATLGIRAANEAIGASYMDAGALGPAWNRLNVNAIESMIGFAQDGTPLAKLLKAAYPDALHAITNALVTGMARGYGVGQVAKMMRDGSAMGLNRAMLISRTELARSYRAASTKQYRDSGVVDGFYRLVKKETACAACLMLDGQRFDVAEELHDHPRGKAELPGNLIETSSPNAFITLYHKGDIVIIGTASGKFLPVTPYHPILTDRGWVAAKFIKEGDNVLSNPLTDGASGVVGPNKDHVPTLVEKIPGAFNMLRLGTVPEAAKHLYSNREDGEVDVIFANRLLWDGYSATQREEIKQYFFGSGDITGSRLSAFRLITENIIGALLSARELLGGRNVSLPLLWGHFGETQIARLGSSPMIDAVLSQYSGDYIARNTKRLSNGLFRFPGNVPGNNIIGGHNDLVVGVGGKFSTLDLRSFGFVPEQPMSLEMIREGLFRSVPAAGSNPAIIASNVVFDRVTQVNVRYFSGHVYSLQTQEEWYCSNNIISHNCVAVPGVIGVGKPQWETGPEWFANQPPERQREILGPGRYKLWQDGQVQLSDFARTKHSDVWGDQPQTPSLTELQGG